ncbi:hypothetical protein [Amycolatopsis sp. cmx-4-54]|uniref:hypothetical protein n=1 Tax=Amycolatopsis sp. cmx-4-54 TaxID=2790936 RepID=UPI00397E1DCC
MTQHHIPPNDTHSDHVIVAGFDRQTPTFFARVYRSTSSGPEHVLWIGRPSSPIANYSVITDCIEPYVDTDKVELSEVATALFLDMVFSPDATTAEANRVTQWDPDRLDIAPTAKTGTGQ